MLYIELQLLRVIELQLVLYIELQLVELQLVVYIELQLVLLNWSYIVLEREGVYHCATTYY